MASLVLEAYESKLSTMTEQIQDVVIYRGQRFCPYPRDGTPYLFDPADYGMCPAGFFSSCWKGFLTQFRVLDNTLCLTDLGVNLVDEAENSIPGPELHGVAPKFGPDRYAEGAGSEGYFADFYNYYKLRHPIHFTGELLLGDDGPYCCFNNSDMCGKAFVTEYEETMGPTVCYNHKILYRLHFNQGWLTKHEDLSELNRQYRDKIIATVEKSDREFEARGETLGPEDESPFEVL